jgi:hypothetical protein
MPKSVRVCCEPSWKRDDNRPPLILRNDGATIWSPPKYILLFPAQRSNVEGMICFNYFCEILTFYNERSVVGDYGFSSFCFFKYIFLTCFFFFISLACSIPYSFLYPFITSPSLFSPSFSSFIFNFYFFALAFSLAH